MFDSQKIDSYFDGNHGLEPYRENARSKGVSWRRVFKLILPCVAAALAGLMVVMPNIKKSVDLKNNITMPRKGEMEKLHIEQTVFNSTDNKNRVNKIVADSIDETKAGSKIMRIVNPKGYIPTESGIANISSNEGFFNQNNNILNLVNDVRAVIDNDTVIVSSEANYDFVKEFGWGDKPVKANGSWGNMTADAFTFDKNKEILTLKGNNKINGKNGSLSAKEKTIIYQNENKSVSEGNAVISQNDSHVYADKIIAYFNESGKKEVIRAEAFGNVIIKTARETARGKEGIYNLQTGEVVLYGSSKKNKVGNEFVSIRQGDNVLYADKIIAHLNTDGKKDLKEAIALGRVKVVTAQEIALGKEGHYNPSTGEIVLYGDFLTEPQKKGNVTIKQGDNVLSAEKITAYLDKNDNGKLQKAVAVGRVVVKTPKGSARGDKGIYNPQANKVELFDNVRIEQNGNFIDGSYAQTDLLTSVSKITGNATTGSRIHGIFYKTRKIKNGNATKK